jgi:hypothetical protein
LPLQFVVPGVHSQHAPAPLHVPPFPQAVPFAFAVKPH